MNVYSIFVEYMDKVQHTRGAYQMSTFIEMLTVMAHVDDLQPLSSTNYPYQLTEPEGIRIAAVYNYIMQNYSSALTLEDAAQQAYLTPNAFCRYFKKHTRVTFTTFLNKVRVNQACKLLINGDFNNIADVAYSCGFTSITNFNYVFKSIAGKAPRDYINDYEKELKIRLR